MHDSHLNSYPDHSELITKFLKNYFDNIKSTSIRTIVGRRMLEYFKECHRKLENVCEMGRFTDSKEGKKVFQLVRIVPTLMQIMRFS
jgi:hypothetical protein